MITRPLDLASQLQPAPRLMDGVFYANVVLLGLFYLLVSLSISGVMNIYNNSMKLKER